MSEPGVAPSREVWEPFQRVAASSIRRMPGERPCGGCAGLGSHTRWCSVTVGRRASLLGRYSEEVHGLADRIGSNEMKAANSLYVVAGYLEREAVAARAEFQKGDT